MTEAGNKSTGRFIMRDTVPPALPERHGQTLRIRSAAHSFIVFQ